MPNSESLKSAFNRYFLLILANIILPYFLTQNLSVLLNANGDFLSDNL